MKRCPTCQRIYTDDTLRFCLEDGTALLTESASTDQTRLLDSSQASAGGEPPPTEILDYAVPPTVIAPDKEATLRRQKPAPTVRQQGRPTIKEFAHEIAPAGSSPDLEVFQTYASGPMSEVESIIWPNPAFDNSITVYGPEVRALVSRYLTQMVGELAALPDPDGRARSLLDAIDLVVPHQANKTMVTSLAREAGLAPERLYFNIEHVGNTSAASIPVALHDAVRDGVIDRPLRVFAPGFGAGAVGGYVVMRVAPAIAA